MSRSVICETTPVRSACAALLLAAAPGMAAPAAAPSWSYRVVRGDTLYSVARQYLAPSQSWQRLQRLNRIADPRRLTPGRELRMPVAWLRAEASVATVAFASGTAHRSADGTGPALAVGDTLQPGDLLVTEAGANVTLRLADGTRVLVAGGSRVRMESLLQFGQSGVVSSRLGLEQGEADSRVNPDRRPGTRYDVRTPALTLGVRGTEFRVRVGEAGEGGAATVAEVTQGRVGASVGGAARAAERPIDAGFGVVARGGQALPGTQALPAAPGLSTLPTLYERVPLRFSWPPAAGATAYRAQVFVDDSLNQRLLDGSFTDPAAQWPDLPDGHYLLQVRAQNAQGLQGRDGQLRFTLKARPEPPFTASPHDEGRVYGERVEFSWTQAAAAQRYRFQLAAESRFETLLEERRDLSGTRLTLTLAPGRYHWRLASIAAGDDQGPFSDSASFELRAVPPPPAVDAPKAQGDKLMFRWRARANDEAYDVQVARDAAFQDLVLERREGLPELVLDKPRPGTYYLRVRTIESDGFVGAYGSAQKFEVPRSLWWWLLPGAALLILL